MDEYREFYTLHLPHLISYVVPVLQSKNGRVEIGSGVLVNADGRHFVATAKHCIDADVRVIRSTNPLGRAPRARDRCASWAGAGTTPSTWATWRSRTRNARSWAGPSSALTGS